MRYEHCSREMKDQVRKEWVNKYPYQEYKDMEDNPTVKGETISMYLIQQFPERRDEILDYFS